VDDKKETDYYWLMTGPVSVSHLQQMELVNVRNLCKEEKVYLMAACIVMELC
jgi:hypothetical protein